MVHPECETRRFPRRGEGVIADSVKYSALVEQTVGSRLPPFFALSFA
jgi:hypothetical protein